MFKERSAKLCPRENNDITWSSLRVVQCWLDCTLLTEWQDMRLIIPERKTIQFAILLDESGSWRCNCKEEFTVPEERTGIPKAATPVWSGTGIPFSKPIICGKASLAYA
jgi:hypothetical protein